VGLSIVGIAGGVAIGVGSGLLRLVPYLGALLGTGLALIVAFADFSGWVPVIGVVFGVEVTARGQALCSFPSNFERDQINAGFGTRRVDWTPPEWISWGLNGWAWVDAFAVNDEDTGPEDGAAVERLRDRRFEPNDFAPIDGTSPERELVAPRGGIWSAPTWDPSAFGGLGGVWFDETSSLVSGFNALADDHEQQRALIPGERISGTVGSSNVGWPGTA